MKLEQKFKKALIFKDNIWQNSKKNEQLMNR